MTDTRFQFFVSSTFEDLRPERQQVIEAILELGHIPVGMEIFPSADDSPWEIIRRTITQSDYYIVLSAGRYGSCGPEGISFTEREFDLATEASVPIIGFLHAKPFDRAQDFRDDTGEARARLLAFHAKVRQRHVRTWTTASELGLQASKAIINAITTHPRTGWVRADKAKSVEDFEQVESLRADLATRDKRIKKLEKDVDNLHELISSTVLPDDEIQPELLAQGEDPAEIVVKATIDSVRKNTSVRLTWNELFSVVGPGLYKVRMRRGYDGKFDFEKPLLACLRDRTELEGATSIKLLRPSTRCCSSLSSLGS